MKFKTLLKICCVLYVLGYVNYFVFGMAAARIDFDRIEFERIDFG